MAYQPLIHKVLQMFGLVPQPLWILRVRLTTFTENVLLSQITIAANVWAGTTTPLDTEGALNYLYGKRFTKPNYNIDLPGILNSLAGTYGLGENLAASLIAS